MGRSVAKKPGKYYVYTLSYPASMGGAIFYVGKGQTNRIDHHEKEARAGKNSHKCSVIRKIWANGEKVVKSIVFYADNEEEAYQYEAMLIGVIGKETLTNCADGGRGGASGISNPKTPEWRAKIGAKSKGRKLSPESIEKMRQTKIGKPAHPNVIKASSKEWSGLVSPTGELIPPFTNLSDFCREYNLRPDVLREVMNGEKYAHKGWTCPTSGHIRKSPSFVFVSPQGELVKLVTSLRQFCFEHNLSASAMNLVFHGKLLAYKGWTRPNDEDIPESYIRSTSEESRLKRSKTYTGFISPNGEVFSPVTNLTQFCLEHGLHQGSMWRVSQDASGKKMHKGWRSIPVH